jgi:hypothetical protein
MAGEVEHLQKLLAGDVGTTLSDGGILTDNLRGQIQSDVWERLVLTFLEHLGPR